MGHNGKDEIMVREMEASQLASAMVEIKIKTMDSQIYTLRVDKCVPVPALKDQIASVTGVVSEQQRLICRGKVLKDDQILSAYHVEDGHTLHLVVRQPIPSLSESSSNNAAADPALSAGDTQGSQRSRVVVGSFNIAEQADGAYSDVGQILSAILGSLGISSAEGVETMGPLLERMARGSVPNTTRDSSGGRSVTPNAVDRTSAPLPSSQPAVIPDSLTTLSEYLNHLRQEFSATGTNATNLQDSGNSTRNVQDSGPTVGENRIPRPSHLAAVLQSARQLLIGEVANSLSNLSRQLEGHENVTDPSTRRLCQSNMFQLGSLLENLGISLLELGRATMLLRLGQTPDDAVVNAGPAVFLSPTGRNPLPQFHPSLLGMSTGGLQAGTAHASPVAGQSLASAPRNIEIRIRTGSWMPSTGTNQREESTTIQQTPEQPSSSGPSITDSVPPTMRGASETSRNPVALVIPVVTRYQQVSSGERSTGLDAIEQLVAESTRQMASIGTPGREGDSSSAPIIGLSEFRNTVHQFLRPVSLPDHVQVGSSESQTRPNLSATASTVTNEAVATAQGEEPAAGTEEGNFISILQQIMPFISQNVSSSSDEAAGRVRNSNRQNSSREEEHTTEVGNSSRRSDPPSPPESKRQRRE